MDECNRADFTATAEASEDSGGAGNCRPEFQADDYVALTSEKVEKRLGTAGGVQSWTPKARLFEGPRKLPYTFSLSQFWGI